MEDLLTNLNLLLKELHIVYQKSLSKANANEQFNVLTTLLTANDEVHLHSRLISSFIDPRAPHKLRDTPLKLFLRVLHSHFHYNLETLEIIPSTSTWTEYKEIDILIIDRILRFAVIIENKIDASDSNHPDEGQIERYYRRIIEEDNIAPDNIEVYYLTRDRHEPSEESVSTSKRYVELPQKVKCISYGNEIKEWLTMLVKEAVNQPYFRETINQYIQLIDVMTNNIDIQERLEIIDLISKNEDMLDSAKFLIDNFNHVKWHTIYDFFLELAESLKIRSYIILEQPSEEIISNIVHGGSKVSKGQSPTITFEKEGLVFEIQGTYYDGLYWGMKYQNNQPSITTIIKEYVKLSERLKDKTDEHWIFWDTFNIPNDDQIDIWNFHHMGTFNLISRQKRQESIKKHLDSIENQTKELFGDDYQLIANHI